MAKNRIRVRVDVEPLNRLIAGVATGESVVRYVADGVEYGLFLELGTEKMGAQPAAVPAVEAVRPGFAKAFKGVLSAEQAEAVIVKTAFDVERGWKQRAAVDTGAYKNSIHVLEHEPR